MPIIYSLICAGTGANGCLSEFKMFLGALNQAGSYYKQKVLVNIALEL